jgi:hypothetical protein
MLFLLAACHPGDPVNQAPWADEDIYMADPYSLVSETHFASATREEVQGVTLKGMNFGCDDGLWFIQAWPSERVAEATFYLMEPGTWTTGPLASVVNYQEEHHQLLVADRAIMVQVPPGWQYAVTDIPCQPLDEKIGLAIEFRDVEGDWLGCSTFGVAYEPWKDDCDPIDAHVHTLY